MPQIAQKRQTNSDLHIVQERAKALVFAISFDPGRKIWETREIF